MDRFDHDGLRFDVTDRGPRDGPAIVALHGFPSDRHCWEAVGDRLVAAGHRVLAPDQRGYSPGARPAGRRAYRIAALGADIVAMVDQAGIDRFHVVGHDWGAAVAWHLAETAGPRIEALTAVSVPHPRAMAAALTHSTQALHSWYMLAFQLPAVPERVLAARDGALLRRTLRGSGLAPDTAARYARRATEGTMTGPLNWYRAIPYAARGRSRPVTVPTTMIWAPGDGFVSRAAAEGAAAWVDGPYRFVEVPGADHWLPESAPGPVAEAILSPPG